MPVRDALQLKRNESRAAVEPSAIKYLEDLFVTLEIIRWVSATPVQTDAFISYVVRIITIVIFFILLMS